MINYFCVEIVNPDDDNDYVKARPASRKGMSESEAEGLGEGSGVLLPMMGRKRRIPHKVTWESDEKKLAVDTKATSSLKKHKKEESEISESEEATSDEGLSE